MRIEIDLSQVQRFAAPPIDYDEDLDDVRSMITDVCHALGDTNASFAVSGFGDDRWPVDVRTDLALFLEQLPAALRAVASNEPFLVDFYEQGIERELSLTPGDDGVYRARCTSRTSWEPDPREETIRREDLDAALQTIRDRWLGFLRDRLPAHASHAWMRGWAGEAE